MTLEHIKDVSRLDDKIESQNEELHRAFGNIQSNKDRISRLENKENADKVEVAEFKSEFKEIKNDVERMKTNNSKHQPDLSWYVNF